MGARVYLAVLGRFTSMDPVPGGAANAYAYALDPINSSDYSGKCVYWIQCASSISISILQPTITVVIVQPTVSTARILSSVAATSQVTFAVSTVRAHAKPAAAPNQSPIASVSAFDITHLKAAGAVPTEGTYVGPTAPRTSFSPYGALDTGTSYYYGGGLIGGIAGCLLGGALTWVAGGVGCVEGGAAGATAGGVIGAGIGAYIGGMRNRLQSLFDWGPDQMDNPWK